MASVLLTPDVAGQAIEMVLPMIEKLAADGVIRGRDLAIVVLDPATVDDSVIGQKCLGDLEKWEHNYLRLAEYKAGLSKRYGLSTRHITQTKPHLCIVGDTKHSGGISLDGIPVGVSGVESYFDEMIANWVAAACLALCMEAMAKIQADPTRDYVYRVY